MTLQIRLIIPEDHMAVAEIARMLPQWFTELGVQQITSDLQTQQGLIALERDHIVGFITYAITVDGVAELT